jgi:uncharacterized membrane protein YphA (DoxX/SURF4 family)
MKNLYVKTVVSILLGFFCLYVGSLKLWKVEAFESWNYPPAILYVVGVVEVISAVLILFPVTRRYGAFGLASLMVLAILTHLYNGNSVLVTGPFVLLLLSGYIVCNHKTNQRNQSESPDSE